MTYLRSELKPLVLTAAMVALFGASSLSHAEETQCRGSIGATTLDNVFVPDGAFCTLMATTIKGNIVVGTGSTLNATRISVGGNVQAEGATRVRVGGNSSINGSVQVVQGGSMSIDRSRVNGDILADSNDLPVAITRNTVGGNVQAFQNTGGTQVGNNIINGNLQCKENAPSPTGGGNRAALKEDQCANL